MPRITSSDLRQITGQGRGSAQEGRVVVELPWPPTVNTYWRQHQGRTLISRKGRAYRQEVRAMLAGCSRVPSGRLSVLIKAHAPDRRRRDLDNITKALLDALQHGGLIEDDGDIDDLRVVRGDVAKANPRVVVTVEGVE